MEKQGINLSNITLASNHNSPVISQEGSSSKKKDRAGCKESTLQRKMVIERMEKEKRLQLKKRLEDREAKIRTMLQERQSKHELAKKQDDLPFRDPSKEGKCLNKHLSSQYIGKTKQNRSQCKQNTIKLYSPTHQLPLLNNHHLLQKQIFSKKKSQVTLLDFGIFTDTKSTQSFLKLFKHTLQQEFYGLVDLRSERELDRLQFLLLKEIHNEGKWIE